MLDEFIECVRFVMHAESVHQGRTGLVQAKDLDLRAFTAKF